MKYETDFEERHPLYGNSILCGLPPMTLDEVCASVRQRLDSRTDETVFVFTVRTVLPVGKD